MSMSQQLPLNINLIQTHDFASFVTGDNAVVTAFLQNDFMQRNESFVYLWGPEGAGKTHLCEAVCQLKHAIGHSSFYLDLSDYQNLSHEVLQGLEKYQLVCLDNIQTVKDSNRWQEALFYFFNRAREQRCCLLVTGLCPPKVLPFKLQDLKSRLSWGLILHLNPLEDADKISMLQKRAENKGIKLTQEVCLYILNHFSRSTHELIQLLERLDKASLIEKRKVTIPFVKKFL